MTLAREMVQLATGFDAAQTARLAAIEGMQIAVHKDLAAGRAALRRTMAQHAETVRADLKGIFGEAAVIRGTAEDVVNRFAREREQNAATLRVELDDFMKHLESSVDGLLTEYGKARKAMSARAEAGRRSELRKLRASVEELLSDAADFIGDLNADRKKAGRSWRRHTRQMRERGRRAAAPKAAAKSGAKSGAKAKSRSTGSPEAKTPKTRARSRKTRAA